MTSSLPVIRGSFAVVVASLVVAGSAVAQKPSEVESARAAFRKAIDTARSRLLAGIDRRIADAKKGGNLDSVDQFSAQKTDFTSTGALPTAPGLQAEVREYQSDRRIAARLLVTALKRAEEAATKADRLDEARQLRQERAEAEGAMASEHPIQLDVDPAALIQPNSAWVGFSKTIGKQPK